MTFFIGRPLNKHNNLKVIIPPSYCYWLGDSFPDCPESITVYRGITVEDNRHGVSRADDGTWLSGSTIFLFFRLEGDFNIVKCTPKKIILQIKTLEGKLNLLSRSNLKVPCLNIFFFEYFEPYVDEQTFFINYYRHFITETFRYLVNVVRINGGIVWRLDIS